MAPENIDGRMWTLPARFNCSRIAPGVTKHARRLFSSVISRPHGATDAAYCRRRLVLLDLPQTITIEVPLDHRRPAVVREVIAPLRQAADHATVARRHAGAEPHRILPASHQKGRAAIGDVGLEGRRLRVIG